MEQLGVIYTHEWSLPVNSLEFQVVLRAHDKEEKWQLKYLEKEKKWEINGQLIEEAGRMRLCFCGSHYFFSLSQPSPEYLFEIEDICNTILRTKNKEMTVSQLRRRIQKKQGVSRAKAYYKGLLEESRCFIRVHLRDTLGKSKDLWRVNKEQLKHFTNVKKSQQTLLIDLTSKNECISMFYKDRQEENAATPKSQVTNPYQPDFSPPASTTLPNSYS